MAPQLPVAEIIRKFSIQEDDLKRLRVAGALLKPLLPELIDHFYDWLSLHSEFKHFFAADTARLERVKAMQRIHWISFFEAEFDEAWFATRRHVGAVHAHIDLPNHIYFAGMATFGKSFTERLQASDSGISDGAETAASVTRLVFLDTYVVIEEISRIQREKIAAGTKALMEMSTPVTPIWEGILLLPLIGIIDSDRTQDIMNKTLNKIAETRAKVFVMDISGVGAMDTAVANQLIKITRATQLMGCETIISGLSPAIARTLVELGISIGDVKTTATLRDSFELALKAVGVDRPQPNSRREAH